MRDQAGKNRSVNHDSREGHPNGEVCCLVRGHTISWVKLENRCVHHLHTCRNGCYDRGLVNVTGRPRHQRVRWRAVEGSCFRSHGSWESQGSLRLRKAQSNSRHSQVPNSLSNSLSKLRSGGKYCCCHIKNVSAQKLQLFLERVASFMGFLTSANKVVTSPFLRVSILFCGHPRPPAHLILMELNRKMPLMELLRHGGGICEGLQLQPKLCTLAALFAPPMRPHVPEVSCTIFKPIFSISPALSSGSSPFPLGMTATFSSKTFPPFSLPNSIHRAAQGIFLLNMYVFGFPPFLQE